MKKKIIIIGPAYPYRGGIADTNESFSKALQDLGHDTTIVTFTVQYPSILFPGKSQYSTDPKPSDLKIIRWINSMNPINWLIAASKINKLNADLIIFRYWLPFLAPCLGFIARLVSKKTKVLALCDNIIPHEKRLMDHRFTNYFVKPFKGFICMSRKVQEELGLFSKAPIYFHEHPINLNLGEEQSKSDSKKYLKLENETNYLLFFGLVRKYKGLALLLKAMADGRLRPLNIKLLVAGEFYDDPAEYYELIKQLGIEDLVVIKNNFIPTDEVKFYFSAADLVTQTYLTASQSGISQMALNYNKAILVTDVGGLSEIVHHQKSGYVVEKDPKAIADAIVDFYKEKREKKFSEQASIEKQKYSWESFSKGLISFAEKL